MSLHAGRSKLYKSLETLTLRWQDTLPRWQDSVRQDFEENQWLPLCKRVESGLRAIDRLDALLHNMRQECG